MLIVFGRKEAHFGIIFCKKKKKVGNFVREMKYKLRELNTMKINLLNLVRKEFMPFHALF